jgi:PIN domain nuclease of toxin-antitoxin system
LSAYLDTHVAVWLHDGLVERISLEARRQIEANDLLVSPMVALELQYLYDRKRLRVNPTGVLSYLNATFGISLCQFPFAAVVLEALSVTWTNDPFDRLIAAQAKANHESMLITADTQIRQNYHRAVW